MNTVHALNFYDAFASVFFLGRRRASMGTLITAASVQAAQHVLDVGCGTGYFTRLLGEAVGFDGRVIGVDASARAIQYARSKGEGLRNVTFRVGAAEALDFADDTFDVVASSLMMHHLPRDRQEPALREMRRVLRPGGTLVLADADIPSHGLSVERLLARVTRHRGMAQRVPDLKALANQAGFAGIRSGRAPTLLSYIVAIKADTEPN
jgi:ubiquinone/menaquinone biosynthesis C-methylase UbiE